MSLGKERSILNETNELEDEYKQEVESLTNE